MQLNPGNEGIVEQSLAGENAGSETTANLEIPTEQSQGVVQENIAMPQPILAQPIVDPVAGQTQAVPNEDEVKEEFSGTVKGSEGGWVNQAKDLIKKFAGKPYSEEEAAEDLNEKYMEKRFGVKIDKGDKN